MEIEELETLECMRIWDNLEEIGDCLVWTGSINTYGHPQYKSTVEHGCRLVRRMVWLFSGRSIGYREPLTCTCGDIKCLNPDHLRRTTTQAIAKQAAKRGAWKSLTRAAKISAKRRTSNVAKLDIEKAREIRLSDEPSRVLAARYGVNRSVVSGIRAGTRWREYTNPYQQLM